MTTTDDLIRRLAADVKPIPHGAGLRRLSAGIVVGAAASLAGLAIWLGAPLQAVPSTGGAAFTMKLLYAVVLFALSLGLLFTAARPGREVGIRLAWLLAPPVLVALSTIMELSTSPAGNRQQLWLGSTWQTCLIAISLFSLPVFAGVLWAFRRLAPTQLRQAGFLAGLTAGSAAAILYALYCPETTATFLLSWYTLGVLIAGLIGLVIGPRLLRW